MLIKVAAILICVVATLGTIAFVELFLVSFARNLMGKALDPIKDTHMIGIPFQIGQRLAKRFRTTALGKWYQRVSGPVEQ